MVDVYGTNGSSSNWRCKGDFIFQGLFSSSGELQSQENNYTPKSRESEPPPPAGAKVPQFPEIWIFPIDGALPVC